MYQNIFMIFFTLIFLNRCLVLSSCFSLLKRIYRIEVQLSVLLGNYYRPINRLTNRLGSYISKKSWRAHQRKCKKENFKKHRFEIRNKIAMYLKTSLARDLKSYYANATYIMSINFHLRPYTAFSTSLLGGFDFWSRTNNISRG